LVVELLKWIPPLPAENASRDDKLADRVARHNRRVYDGKYDLVELEDWIRGMENIFTVLDVSEEKKANIGTFYVIGEADIWWNIVKDKLLGPEFTWSKFRDELRAEFYPVVVQR